LGLFEDVIKPSERRMNNTAFEFARDVSIAPLFASKAYCHVLSHLINIRLRKELLRRGMSSISYVQESGMRNWFIWLCASAWEVY
jgi:hypothetical protein